MHWCISYTEDFHFHGLQVKGEGGGGGGGGGGLAVRFMGLEDGA